jgi:large subunit ribosomal protein L14
MLQLRSVLKVADNSGAKYVSLIGIPGRGNKVIAKLGDIITVVVKKADPTGQVRTHQVVRAVIVRTKKEFGRPDGSYIRFDENACVVLDAKTKIPKGSRIFGPIAREIKQFGFNKIASLAKEIY